MTHMPWEPALTAQGTVQALAAAVPTLPILRAAGTHKEWDSYLSCVYGGPPSAGSWPQTVASDRHVPKGACFGCLRCLRRFLWPPLGAFGAGPLATLPSSCPQAARSTTARILST
eukprot:scaffold95331_cov69-Phaeocystis_antarctica.AAC.4